MESAQIIPINRTKPFMQLAFPKKQETTETLHPGKVITIAPEIRMGIAYDKVNDEYIPRFKFWHNETPLKQLYPKIFVELPASLRAGRKQGEGNRFNNLVFNFQFFRREATD